MCQHFNLPSTYVDVELPVYDWYCMISVALDEEEDRSYERVYVAYIGAGGDPKKFPKPRKKITAPGRVDGESIVVDALSRSTIPIAKTKGSIEDYARAKKLTKVYRHPDGTITDEHGKVIEQRPGFAFVPVSSAKNDSGG